MPYDQSAAGALQGGAQQGASDQEPTDQQGADQSDQSDEGAFFIPGDFDGADELKAGDTLTLQVIGKDGDGQLQVKPVEDDDEAGEGQDTGMMQNFDKEMK